MKAHAIAVAHGPRAATCWLTSHQQFLLEPVIVVSEVWCLWTRSIAYQDIWHVRSDILRMYGSFPKWHYWTHANCDHDLVKTKLLSNSSLSLSGLKHCQLPSYDAIIPKINYLRQCNIGPVHLAYNPSYSACFFSRNSIFLSQKISQQCFSAGL
jgi:hypothetical protein